MLNIKDLKKIEGVVNSTDLNYNFLKIKDYLELAVEGVVFNSDYSQLETIELRNNISEEFLVPGLWVAVSENGIVYEYNKKNDVKTEGIDRYFGIEDGDLPNIPYRLDGDASSGPVYNIKYICRANNKENNWKYFSETTGETYNDGDWAVYLFDRNGVGYWKKIPKWIPIMNVTSILENNLIGKLEDLHTEDKTKVVNAINEIHDDLGTVQNLTTKEKTNAVGAINELDSDIGNLEQLTTDVKDSIVLSINEVDGNIGELRKLETENKSSLVSAVNELNNEHGNLENLHTVAKDNFVNSINEIHDDLGTLSELQTNTKISAVFAINELENRIGKLNNLTTVSKDNLVQSINEVDTDVGDISDLITSNKSNVVRAINELKTLTDTLRGASIIIGKIQLNTSEITEELLTQRALEIMKTDVLQIGWTLVDNEQHEWHWNGESWQDLEQPNIYPAQNETLGTVRGNANGDVSITDGNITVLHAANSSQLDGQNSDYYATKEYADTKADKNNVLELDNITPYTPTEDYHPTTKAYVDDLIGTASWGKILNNIEDQEDLMLLLNDRPTKMEVLTRDNTIAFTPTEDYHPATKNYVDQKLIDINTWGKISGDIKDQQDLQDELIKKQDFETSWNTSNLIVSTEQPEIPENGFIIWVDLNS